MQLALYRCHLPTAQHRWLCEEHSKESHVRPIPEDTLTAQSVGQANKYSVTDRTLSNRLAELSKSTECRSRDAEGDCEGTSGGGGEITAKNGYGQARSLTSGEMVSCRAVVEEEEETCGPIINSTTSLVDKVCEYGTAEETIPGSLEVDRCCKVEKSQHYTDEKLVEDIERYINSTCQAAKRGDVDVVGSVVESGVKGVRESYVDGETRSTHDVDNTDLFINSNAVGETLERNISVLQNTDNNNVDSFQKEFINREAQVIVMDSINSKACILL